MYLLHVVIFRVTETRCGSNLESRVADRTELHYREFTSAIYTTSFLEILLIQPRKAMI